MLQKDDIKVQFIEHIKEELGGLATKLKVLETIQEGLSNFFSNKFAELIHSGGGIYLSDEYRVSGIGRDIDSYEDQGKGSFFILFYPDKFRSGDVIGEGRWFSREVQFRDHYSYDNEDPRVAKDIIPFLGDFFKAMGFKILGKGECFSSGEYHAMWF